MKNLTRFTLKFAVGFAAAILVLEGFNVIQGRLSAKRIHTASFSAPESRTLPVRGSRTVVTGRVLAHGAAFRDTLDLVTSSDWLLALRSNNRLTGLNLRNGTVRDFSAILAGQQRYVQYAFMWRGQRDGEIFLGNLDHMFVRLSVTSEGIPTGTHSLVRPSDMTYSLPVAGEKWLSNGYFRDGTTTLVVGRLVGDHLTRDRAIKRPVFPGLLPFVSLEANRNSVAAKPDGQRLAQAFWYAPYIYIYDNTGAFLHSIAPPISINQAFGEQLVHGDVRMRHLPETTLCYIDVVASNKTVIGLFSGKEERESPRIIQGSQLDVFSWEGQLIEVVNLDSSVSRIEENATEDILWAVRRGSDPAILEYRIPGLSQ